MKLYKILHKPSGLFYKPCRHDNMKSENWLIWSYEHDAWWKPNSMGYTRKYLEAGRYSEKEAERICKQADIGRRLLSSVMPPEIMVIENVAEAEYLKNGDNW